MHKVSRLSRFNIASLALGLAFLYLPILILVIYSFNASRLVTFPLSLPGVGAGVLLCFIPIVGEFVIPDLLAGSNSLMIGQTLWLEFFTNKDWPVASAAAIVLLVVLLLPLLLYERLQRRQLEEGR